MSGPDENHDEGEEEPVDPRSTADRLLAPLYEDSTLWGLLVVVALTLATFLASILLMAFERRPFAVAALLGVGWMSIDAIRRNDSRGPTARLILGLWVLAGLIALGSRLSGLF